MAMRPYTPSWWTGAGRRRIMARSSTGIRTAGRQVESERIISGSLQDDDLALDTPLRPRRMEEFIGQQKIKENLGIAVAAALQRQEPLDHVLLYGPPGLGKTTLGHIIAHEIAVSIPLTSGPAIQRAGGLAAIL